MTDKACATMNMLFSTAIALFLIGAVFVICSMMAGLTVPGVNASENHNPPDSFPKVDIFAHLEPLTQQNLKAIRQRLIEDGATRTRGSAETLRAGLIRASMWGPLAGVTSRILELLGDSETARKALFFLMPVVRWMSEPFLFPVETSGPQEQQAAEMERLFAFILDRWEEGRSVSLDNVGDAARHEQDVIAYRNYYRTMIRLFARNTEIVDLSLSLKLSALTLDLPGAAGSDGEARTKRREIQAALTDLLQTAQEVQPTQRLLLRLDMEEYIFRDVTLELFRSIVEEHPELVRNEDGSLRLGVVIQAYLRDSARSVRELAAWARARDLRVPIRLVKGAYLEHERSMAADQGRPSPVWDHKPSTDASYEILSACLLLNRDVLQPAFATHNIRSMARVMALAEILEIPAVRVEFQMLHGMGDPLKPVLTDMGYRLREYIPAGSLARGLKYSGRRFHELAGADNALARTLRGDFSVVEGTPEFIGAMDSRDGQEVWAFLRESYARPVLH